MTRGLLLSLVGIRAMKKLHGKPGAARDGADDSNTAPKDLVEVDLPVLLDSEAAMRTFAEATGTYPGSVRNWREAMGNDLEGLRLAGFGKEQAVLATPTTAPLGSRVIRIYEPTVSQVVATRVESSHGDWLSYAYELTDK